MDARHRFWGLPEDRSVVAHRWPQVKIHFQGLHGERVGDEQAEHAAEVPAVHLGGAGGQERVRPNLGVGQERLRPAGSDSRELRKASLMRDCAAHATPDGLPQGQRPHRYCLLRVVPDLHPNAQGQDLRERAQLRAQEEEARRGEGEGLGAVRRGAQGGGLAVQIQEQKTQENGGLSGWRGQEEERTP